MSAWITLDCERALYLDNGRTRILCDRLSSPVTLVVKLASGMDARSGETACGLDPKDDSPTAEKRGRPHLGGIHVQ